MKSLYKIARFSFVQNARAQHVLAKSNFLPRQMPKSSNWPEILRKSADRCAFHENLYKTHVSGRAQHVLAKSNFLPRQMPKSSNWPEILRKSADRCAFHEICTKRTFQAVRSTFWPNPSFCPARCQNRQTGLKFCANRRIGALFMHVSGRAQHVLYKTHVSGRAQHVLAKSKILPRQMPKSSNWPEILRKSADRCAFHEICTKRTFQAVRSTFWPNPSFCPARCQNRQTGLKFCANRRIGALFMKFVQNARFRPCAARFGQIQLFAPPDAKIVKLA